MIIVTELEVDLFSLLPNKDPKLTITLMQRKALCGMGAKISESVPFKKLTLHPGKEKYSINVVVVEKERWDRKINELKKMLHDNLSVSERNIVQLLISDLLNN